MSNSQLCKTYSQVICSLDFTKIPQVLKDKEKPDGSTRHAFLQMLESWLASSVAPGETFLL